MKEEKNIQKDPVKDVKRKLTLIIGILLFTNLCLLVYICLPGIKQYGQEMFPNLGIWSDQEEEETTEQTEEEDGEILNEEETEIEEEEVMEAFEGEYVSATLPEDWSVVEYFDGDGTDMITSGTVYTGLTGMSILNADSTVVFSMEAVDGIGFVGCGDYAIFDDDNSNYYQEQVDSNNEVGITMDEHDYTNTEYSEFEWLGTTMRRVEDIYYYDTEDGNNYFEPPCVPGLITLEGLTFETGGYTGESYFYGLTDDAQESEYEIVDEILESMEAI